MDVKQGVADLLEQVRTRSPLVHHITNYVTANDCANIVLALGGSPIMADAIEEVSEMVSISSALVLNMGTLNARTVDSMLVAGKMANRQGIPIVLDPVGAGATSFRSHIADRIINEMDIAIIRGNISEIKAISGIGHNTKGVDASDDDIAQFGDLKYVEAIGKGLSNRLGCVVAITGVTDTITNGAETYFIDNGHEMMSRVTGTGCMCTSLIGAYCGVTDDYLLAAAAGVLTMGLAGEIGYEKLTSRDDGSGSFKIKIMDSVYQMKGKDILERGELYAG